MSVRTPGDMHFLGCYHNFVLQFILIPVHHQLRLQQQSFTILLSLLFTLFCCDA